MAVSGELVGEALYLAELVVAHLPDAPEALGLMSLLCLCEARRPARLDAQGGFVPLHQQESSHWDETLMRTANACLVPG
nr:DUF6596 domain-containing protein [Janthinobacterium sp.]